MFKMKKSSATRAFACLLILFMLLAGWAIAENAVVPEAEPEVVEQVEETPAAAASEYMPNMVADPADVAQAVEDAAARQRRRVGRTLHVRDDAAPGSRTAISFGCFHALHGAGYYHLPATAATAPCPSRVRGIREGCRKCRGRSPPPASHQGVPEERAHRRGSIRRCRRRRRRDIPSIPPRGFQADQVPGT